MKRHEFQIVLMRADPEMGGASLRLGKEASSGINTSTCLFIIDAC